MTVALTAGKVRSLAATSTAEGVFAVLAADHRDSMRAVLDPNRPQAVPAQDLTDLKLDLVRAVAPHASGVMLDPEYGIAPAILARALPAGVGLVAAVESQGYLGDEDATETHLLEGWGVAKAKRVGAAGIKLLVLHGDNGVSDQQRGVVRRVVDECHRHDIALFLEPLARRPPPDRRGAVVANARSLGALGPDVLKLPFPADVARRPDGAAWADACAELDETCPVPWALLSAGEDFATFRDQLAVACEAGASGFMAGRALWRDAAVASGEERRRLIDEVVVPRFLELRSIAVAAGRDWAARYTLEQPDPDWFRRYGETE